MQFRRLEYGIILVLFAFLAALALTVDYQCVVNYLFGDEAVYYMMAQSFAYDLDLEYTQKDLWRVYQDGWSAGPQGVFLRKIADFTLTDASFEQLRSKKMPDDLLQKLTPLKGQTLRTQNVYLDAIAEKIGKDAEKQYAKELIAAAQKTNERIFYSKSFIYSLMLAPFLFLFGFKGFLVLNMLLLFGMILMGWLYLRQFNAPLPSLLVSMTFFLLSASLIYTYWLTPETFNMFCVAAGLFCWLYKRELPHSADDLWYRFSRRSRLLQIVSAPFTLLRWLFATPDGRFYLAPIPIAVAAASKLPNVLFILPIVADALFEGGVRIFNSRAESADVPNRRITIFRAMTRFAAICATFWVVFLLFYGLQKVFTGDFNPYAGDRKTFYWNFPFGEAEDAWEKGIRLSNDDYADESFYFSWSVLFHNLYYYIVGRFTGILPYFFCTFVALWYFLRSLIKEKLIWNAGYGTFRVTVWQRRVFLALTVAASMFAYIYMAPSNYQGGGGAFGNRFYLNIYPGVFFLMTTLSSLIPLTVGWIVGAAFLAQSLVNPFQTSTYPAFQAFRAPFRWLPVELTLLNTLPTNVNSKLTQSDPPGETPLHRLYYFDENMVEQTSREFYARGKKQVDAALRLFQPQAYLTIKVMNGPLANQVDVSVAGQRQTIDFAAALQMRQVVFSLKEYVPFFKSLVYPISVRSQTGFVPKFTAGTGLNSPRYLGCLAQMSFDPFDAASAFVAQGHANDAIPLLENMLQQYPDHIRARSLLATAYWQVGRWEDAETRFQECAAQMPQFAASFQNSVEKLNAPKRTKTPEKNTNEQSGLPDYSAEISKDAAQGKNQAAPLFLKAEIAGVPLGLKFEAENLSHGTGDVEADIAASNGSIAEYRADKDPAGFLVFGPEITLPAGTYQVKFRANSTPKPGLSQAFPPLAITLDVYSKRHGVLAKCGVPADAATPPRFRDYALDVALMYPDTLEFRVETTGLASVKVDAIEVYPRLPLDMLQGMATVNAQLGKLDVAYDNWQQALAIDSESPAAQAAYLRLLFAQKHWDEARQFISEHADFSEFHTGLLSELFETSDVPDTLKTLLPQFAPQTSSNVVFGDALEFAGHTLASDALKPGDTLNVEYFWKGLRRMEEDYTIFVHVIRKGTLFASENAFKAKRKFGMATGMFQQDHRPLDGTYPTTAWLPGERVRDVYAAPIPPDTRPGTYEIWIGVWNPLTKERLKTANGEEKIRIGEMMIQE
ncbi:putative lipoprotein [Candidatus Moduliflexus flocculans]|uniref:Putative lipoprotein n=1 Tax=Candidatus Moduliflexus flocculans TaxID=1499966 RepID=A0A0S6VQP6_9BACT|nr:putative lipoprotein [Candidatus Moduliflexus flocculans]